MARIIPDISGAFGMQRPHLQKFRRPKAPKRSGAQEAADIMSLIQSGVGTAAGLYGLGRGIYEDFRETDDEAVARLQREAIAQRAKFMQPGAATLEFGVKPEFADPASVGWTDEPRLAGGNPLHGARYAPEAMTQTTPMRHFPSAAPGMTQEQMLESIATGVPIPRAPSATGAPLWAQEDQARREAEAELRRSLADNPFTSRRRGEGLTEDFPSSFELEETLRRAQEERKIAELSRVPYSDLGEHTGATSRILASDITEPSYAPSVAPTREELVTLTEGVPEEWGVERLPFVTEAIERAPLGTPEDKAVVEAAAELLKQEGNEDQIPALIEGLRGPEGRSRLELLKARLAEIIPAEMEAKFAPIQKAGMRALRSEILASEEQAERALPSAVTAREFLDRSFGGEQFNISDLASSYGGLMARGKEAEARELLRLARGAGDYASFITNPNEPPSLVEARARDAIKKGALAQPGERTIGLKEVSQIASMVSKGKGRKASPKGRRKRRKGADAEGVTDDGIRRKVLKNVGIGRVGEMSDAQVQSSYKDVINKVARGVYGEGKAAELKNKFGVDVLASEAAVKRAVGAKREERTIGAAEAGAAAQAKRAKTDAEKAANKKKEGHKRALTSVGMRYSDAVGNVAAHKSDLASRVSNKKAKIAKARKSLRNLGEGGAGAARIRAKIKSLEDDIAVIVTAQNALDEIEAAPAPFGLPSFTVPTD